MTPRYLDIPAASSYLSLTKRALYLRVANRSIPFIKKGRRVWFDRVALDRWMREGEIDGTARELHQPARNLVYQATG